MLNSSQPLFRLLQDSQHYTSPRSELQSRLPKHLLCWQLFWFSFFTRPTRILDMHQRIHFPCRNYFSPIIFKDQFKYTIKNDFCQCLFYRTFFSRTNLISLAGRPKTDFCTCFNSRSSYMDLIFLRKLDVTSFLSRMISYTVWS